MTSLKSTILQRKGEIGMKRKLSSYAALIGSMSLILCLTLATLAQAADSIVKWSAPVTFTVKLTTHETDPKENIKLVTSKETFEGTVNFYWDNTTNTPALPAETPAGCILELVQPDGTEICFDALYGLDYGKINTGKKDWEGTLLAVATGTFALPVGTPPVVKVEGIAYGSTKASIAVNSSRQLTSFKGGGTLSGGYTDPATGNNYIFSATVPTTTLTK
jgi:hypothetical protein